MDAPQMKAPRTRQTRRLLVIPCRALVCPYCHLAAQQCYAARWNERLCLACGRVFPVRLARMEKTT